MRPASDPPPARLFFGAFSGFPELFDWTRERLAAVLGSLAAELESPTFAFPETRTYARSMGEGLQRRFFVAAARVPQDCLAEVKHRARAIEAEALSLRAWPVARPLNLDPGLLNDCRVILASTKDHSHRLYRGQGVWEEVTLRFVHGAFEPLPWTYPDFRAPDCLAYFARLRAEHLEWLRAPRAGETPP